MTEWYALLLAAFLALFLWGMVGFFFDNRSR